MTTALAPGCNLPSIGFSPRHPGLWAQHITSTANGLISALGGEEARRSDDRFKHLVCFPSWSSGEVVFVRVPDGETVIVSATSDSDLEVTLGGATIATTKEQILVVFHGSLDFEAVKAYYSQEG